MMISSVTAEALYVVGVVDRGGMKIRIGTVEVNRCWQPFMYFFVW